MPATSNILLTSSTNIANLSEDWKVLLGSLGDIKDDTREIVPPLVLNLLNLEFSSIWYKKIRTLLWKGCWKVRRLQATIPWTMYGTVLYSKGIREIHRRKNSCFINGSNPLLEYDHYIYHYFECPAEIPIQRTNWWIIPNMDELKTSMKIIFPSKEEIKNQRASKRLRGEILASRMKRNSKKSRAKRIGTPPTQFVWKYHIEGQELSLSYDAERRDSQNQLKFY